MKKIKRFFSAKGNAETSSLGGRLGKRNSSISSIAGHPLNYDVRSKDLDKIHKAVLDQDEKKVELLALKHVNTKDKRDRTPLHLACAVGNVAVVEKLLTFNASINTPDGENKTPLLKAIECGHIDCARLLLQKKVDLTCCDKNRNTCLHYLCMHDMSDLIPLAMQKVSLADKTNEFGQNPLHLAIDKNNKTAISLLLENGMNANASNQNSITPLMMACRKGYKDIVLLLLRHGADPSLKDPHGNTAADLAMKMGFENCVKEIEYFHERNENHKESPRANEAQGGDSSMEVKSDKTSNKAHIESGGNTNGDLSEDSDGETNDFYKGKASIMLSKILKDNTRTAVIIQDQHNTSWESDTRSPKKILGSCDDDDDDKKSNSSFEKKDEEISMLKNQAKFLSHIGDLSNIGLNQGDDPYPIDDASGMGDRNTSHVDQDNACCKESCWDSSYEDPGAMLIESQQANKSGVNEAGTCMVSEISYPVITEKFQHLNSQSDLNNGNQEADSTPSKLGNKSEERSFHEMSDEDFAEIEAMNQAEAYHSRRLPSIDNQIGSFIKSENQELDRLNENQNFRKHSVDNWDSMSEESSNFPIHVHEVSINKNHSGNMNFELSSQSIALINQLKTGITSLNSSQQLSKEAIILNDNIKNGKGLNSEEVEFGKDIELEQIKGKMKLLENENAVLRSKVEDSSGFKSQEIMRLNEAIASLQGELNKISNEGNNLRAINEELKSRLNVGEKLLDQEAQSHKNEIISLKKESLELQNMLINYQQSKQRLDQESQNDNELRAVLKVSDERLKQQADTCKELERQLAEQRSKIMKVEFDNNRLEMSLDGKTNQCSELGREVSKLKMQHEDITKELLAEKEKFNKANLMAETHQEKIGILQKEFDILKGINKTSSSVEEFLKTEHTQKVTFLDELNEELKRTISKLREELDLQRSKHENECKTLNLAKNELFNKLVLAESHLRKESISRQFLESEVQQMTKELERLKEKLSIEQNQRQAIELKMISMSHVVEISKSSSTNIESKLNQKSEALSKLEQENESLKASIHKTELEKVKMETSLKMEHQMKERLQEELKELKDKLPASLKEGNKHLRMKVQLQQKVQDLAGSKDMDILEAENNRELGENEVKSKSKLGLGEQIKLRRAMENNLTLNEELKLEENRGEILTQRLAGFNRTSNARHRNKVKYNHSSYLINTTCKKCRRKNDEKTNNDLKWEAEKLKKEIEERTQAEFLEKLQQVYHFLEEQTLIRSRNEQKRMENLELLKKNLLIYLEQPENQNDNLCKESSFSEKTSKVQTFFEDLGVSETKLRDRLNRGDLNYSNFPFLPTSKAYTTEDILQQLEKSIKSCNKTI